jgi:hypothetical protein
MCYEFILCYFIYFISYFFLIFSKDVDHYCVIHVSGQRLFPEAKGRSKGGSRIKLPFYNSMQEKMLEMRGDFQLHNDTQMMVMLSICTKEMNRYVSMFPEVWFIDCTAGEFVHKCFTLLEIKLLNF